MVKSAMSFGKRYADIFFSNRLPRAAAAMSYHLTMTMFPLVIVLYSLLGSNYTNAIRILNFLQGFMAHETVDAIKDFLMYVASNNSTAMMVAGICVLMTSASAAARTILLSIGDIQGGVRFKGIPLFAVSLVASVALIFAVYFGIIILYAGRALFTKLNSLVSFIDISGSWIYLRFLLLWGIEFLVFWAIFYTAKRRSDTYLTYPGAMLSTLAISLVSVVFALFIGASARYPLVYGSLAAIILLMFWLYSCCMAVFAGAALNIAMRDIKKQKPIKKPAK